MKYTMKIAGLERSLPLCPLNDDVYIAAFVIFGDPELTTAAAKELLARAPEYDYIITAESKGIPLAHEMSRLAGNRKYFLARKAPKLYMDGVFEVTVRSITTSGELVKIVSACQPGDEITLTVYRQGESEQFTLTLTVGEQQKSALADPTSSSAQQQSPGSYGPFPFGFGYGFGG